MPDQIRFRTLLKEDEVYRQWFAKEPDLTSFHTGKPWRFFVQLERHGRWSRADIQGYPKAYTQVKLRLRDAWDMAVHCKVEHFPPPTVQTGRRILHNPMPIGHRWCDLCRRPTVFTFFKRHPNMRYPTNPEERRCSICGARAQTMPLYESPLSWPAQLAKPLPVHQKISTI